MQATGVIEAILAKTIARFAARDAGRAALVARVEQGRREGKLEDPAWLAAVLKETDGEDREEPDAAPVAPKAARGAKGAKKGPPPPS